MKEAAVRTSWATPPHVGLIAAMPTDDLLMVYDDGAEGVCEMVQGLRAYPPGLARTWNA